MARLWCALFGHAGAEEYRGETALRTGERWAFYQRCRRCGAWFAMGPKRVEVG